MRGIFRGLPAVVALIALLAGAPLLHSHPLTGNDGPCAVCATSADRLPPAEPVAGAALIIIGTLTPRHETTIPIAVPLPRASRAPPA